MSMRWAICRPRARLCDTMTTVRSPARYSGSCSAASGSSPSSGSSSSSSGGSGSSALAIASRWLIPRENVRTRSSRRRSRFTSRRSAAMRSVRCGTSYKRPKNARFSVAVRSAYSIDWCATYPICLRTFAAACCTSCPPMLTRPLSNPLKVVRIRSRVLFPAPLGPNTMTNCPAPICTLRSRSTHVRPYRLRSP